MAEWTEAAYRNGCISKRGYDSKAKAREALRTVQRKGKAEGWDTSRLNIWRCGICRLFHVGHDNTVDFASGRM